MLQLRFKVDQEAMEMKGVLCIPQSSSITRDSSLDCLVSYPEHSLGESYPSAQMQSVYFTAPNRLGNRFTRSGSLISLQRCSQFISAAPAQLGH